MANGKFDLGCYTLGICIDNGMMYVEDDYGMLVKVDVLHSGIIFTMYP